MEEVNALAKIIWDYHHLHHQLKKSDCIFVLGSLDTRVAEYASDLFLDGYAAYIIFSGGFGVVTKNVFEKPEADLFAEIAIKRGVPSNKILIENRSTNTGENVEFTKQLLREKKLNPQTFILVQKPYMERRTFATFSKIWPEKEFIVTSPPLSFEQYPNEVISRERTINYLVGDLQRIKVYPTKGWQIYQEIPPHVWDAFEKLVALGYDKHLIAE